VKTKGQQDASCNPYQPFCFDDFPQIQPKPCNRRSPSLVGVHALYVRLIQGTHMKIQNAIASLTLAVSLVGCATSSERSAAWEHKIVSGKTIGSESTLGDAINRAASEGWQFVSAGPSAEQWGFAVLRRKKQ
jgi:hypothetical protein